MWMRAGRCLTPASRIGRRASVRTSRGLSRPHVARDDELHMEALNEAQHARALVAALERECERLRRVIRAYESAETHPAADGAVFRSTKGRTDWPAIQPRQQ